MAGASCDRIKGLGAIGSRGAGGELWWMNAGNSERMSSMNEVDAVTVGMPRKDLQSTRLRRAGVAGTRSAMLLLAAAGALTGGRAAYADGAVVCWGYNQYGQCNTPPGLGVVTAIAAGYTHTVALKADGAVVAWGNTEDNTPPGLGVVTAIAAGDGHTVALKADGAVVAWGSNWAGQCNTPPGLGVVTAIAAGRYHTVAITCGLAVDVRRSPDLGNFGNGVSREHAFTALPPTIGEPATLTISAIGDLDLATEFLIVKLDGLNVGTVFSTVGSASDCPTVPNRAQLSISAKTYAALAADGAITIRIDSSAGVNAAQCPNGSLVLQLELPELYQDCDGNGSNDSCDIHTNQALDCNGNGVLDSCESGGSNEDCNSNGTFDACEIAVAPTLDCDGNGSLDTCGIAADPSLDCNNNGTLDTCDISASSAFFDCDSDGLIDTCEIAADPALDCNLNGALDSCDLASGAQDKDGDSRLDACEVARGDFDLDDAVGAADLAQLLDLWGLQNPPYGDLNGDGTVGGPDLTMLLANWGPLY